MCDFVKTDFCRVNCVAGLRDFGDHFFDVSGRRLSGGRVSYLLHGGSLRMEQFFVPADKISIEFGLTIEIYTLPSHRNVTILLVYCRGFVRRKSRTK